MSYKLAVVDEGVNFPPQYFQNGFGTPKDVNPAPVNWRAYAATTNAAFFTNRKELYKEEYDAVVFLKGRRDFKGDLKKMLEAKSKGGVVLGAFKGTGLPQLLPRISKPAVMKVWREAYAKIDGAIAPTKALLPILKSVMEGREDRVRFIPTPYPVDIEAWNFETDVRERSGIYLGTREFNHDARHHLYALYVLKNIVRETGEKLTVINQDGAKGRDIYKAVGFKDNEINILDKRLPYVEYLKMLTKHKFIFQLDQSSVPGQVAGDAALCRMPCIGGNGTNESILFPDLTSQPEKFEESVTLAIKMAKDVEMQKYYIDDSQKRAMHELSPSVIREELNDFIKYLKQAR